MKKRTAIISLLAAAVLTFGLYVKYISISEIGAKYVGVFFTNLSVKAIAHITSFLLIFALFYVSISLYLSCQAYLEIENYNL